MYRISLPENLGGKGSRSRPVDRCEGIKIDLKHGLLRCKNVNWTHLAPNRIRRRDLVGTVMNLRVH